MKAEIKDGNLFIQPESKTEEFAISKWFEMQEVEHCNGSITTKALFYDILKPKKSIKQRIQLWMLNNGFIK